MESDIGGGERGGGESAPLEEEAAVFGRPLFAPALDGRYSLPNNLGNLSVFTRTIAKQKDTDHEGAAMLFVDDIWPAAYVLSDYLCRDTNRHIIYGKHVIELGAGAGLPSCVAAKLGAAKVVATDYPARNVVDNLSRVFAMNGIANASAASYIWGDNTDPLLEILINSEDECRSEGFDLILMADLLWKDTYQFHRNILNSIKKLSKSSSQTSSLPICLVAFAHRSTESHTPSKDLEFFELASSEEYGYVCRLVDVCDKYSDNTDGDYNPREVYLYAIHDKAPS